MHKRIAVFLSGRGSNFQSILKQIKKGIIKAEISVVITDNPNAGALAITEKENISSEVIIRKDFKNIKAYNNYILKTIKKYKSDFIVLAGYLKIIGSNIVKAYKDKIINIHPALLPLFGGKGMYGINVHKAVLESGMKVSGVTVHFVDETYDTGTVIAQVAVKVENNDTPEELAHRILKCEHKIYPYVVKKLIDGKIKRKGRKVYIRP